MPPSLTKIDFPYYHYYVSSDFIKLILEEFRKFGKPFPYEIKSTSMGEQIFSMKVDFDTQSSYLTLSDYFNHPARMSSKFLFHPSPFDFFQSNRDEMIKEIGENPDYEDVDSYIFKNCKICSNFPITVMKMILEFYKPKRVFDPSAGWGDRMLACIAADIPYTGVDPNKKLIEGYQNMNILFNLDPEQYKLITSPIEEYNPSDVKYDMIITSPPFFNMEKYANDPEQSHVRYKSYEEWKRRFLYPLLRKCYLILESGGKMIIYVNNIKGHSIFEDTKFYMSNMKNLNYDGFITWQNTKYPKKLMVWSKE